MNSVYILSGLGILSLLAEIFNFRKILFPIVLLGLLAAVAVLVMSWGHSFTYFNDMLLFNNYASAFSIGLSFIALLWFLMSKDYFQENTHVTDHFALVLFALVGAVFMVSYSNLAMLFLGIEILSIPLYVLAGSKMRELSSNEAAFKYFLMGAFATGFLLFGIALIYGATGSFDLFKIAGVVSQGSSPFSSLIYIGILMIMVGLSFKVAAAPFHFWAPDVYEGSPTVITAFMSTIVKIAAFAAFYRLFSTCFASATSVWSDVVQALTILTLIIGNVTAIYQNNVKRIFAYSSVAHAGYMLITLISLNDISSSAVFYYAISYSVASIGAFTVLHNLAFIKENVSVEAFNGLAKRNPFLAFAMTISLLSLASIPPLAGFFAKYYIFTAAIQNHHIGLVILAVVTSLIGIYYYFRIIIAMYIKEADVSEPLIVSSLHKILLGLIVIIIVVLGIVPEFFVHLF